MDARFGPRRHRDADRRREARPPGGGPAANGLLARGVRGADCREDWLPGTGVHIIINQRSVVIPFSDSRGVNLHEVIIIYFPTDVDKQYILHIYFLL